MSEAAARRIGMVAMATALVAVALLGTWAYASYLLVVRLTEGTPSVEVLWSWADLRSGFGCTARPVPGLRQQAWQWPVALLLPALLAPLGPRFDKAPRTTVGEAPYRAVTLGDPQPAAWRRWSRRALRCCLAAACAAWLSALCAYSAVVHWYDVGPDDLVNGQFVALNGAALGSAAFAALTVAVYLADAARTFPRRAGP